MSRLSAAWRKYSAGPKTWAGSQKYEMDFARGYMSSPEFLGYLADYRLDRQEASKKYLDQFFFAEHPEEFEAISHHAKNRLCLEIGPSAAPVIFGFGSIPAPAVIEPLGAQIVDFQQRQFSFDMFDGTRLYSQDAAIPIPELENAVDGVIYSHNCLDHTPRWLAMLSNISHYAAPGCRLVFWSELRHLPAPDEGHYDITDDADEMARLFEALGFRIDRRFSRSPELPDLGIVGTKMARSS